MNSLSAAFLLTTARPGLAVSDATFLYIPFSIHAVSQIPKIRKHPALKERPSKPNKKISPAPVLASSTAPSSSIPRKKKVLVPIGFGTEEMEAVIMIGILRRAGAEVTLASVEEQLEVEASGGTRLVADTFISSCSGEIFDLVALPGGMPGSARLRDCKILQDITVKHAENKRLYGAICAAPAVALLPWGLLKRKQTTCHPAFMDKLPTFWAVKSSVQVSGELTTSRGPGTCFEFAVSLVEQLFGKSVALGISDLMLLNADANDPKKEEFNDIAWALDHTPQILVPAANGSEEIEVVTIVDILRRAKAKVIIASLEKSLRISASTGTKIVADKMISAAAESTYDLIILPGGVSADARLQKSRILKKLLKEQESAGRFIGAICSSLAILEGYGLLKGRHATAHSLVMGNVNNMATDARVVVDGQLITSKGRANATDFALAIVSKLFGVARARSVAEGLVLEYPR